MRSFVCYCLIFVFAACAKPVQVPKKTPEPAQKTPYISWSTASVSADKMNVLYIGVENPLSIGITGVSSQDINVQIDHGTIQKVGGGKYIIREDSICDVRIFVKDNKSFQRTFYFRAKAIPDPVAWIGAQKTQHFTAKSFLDQRGLACIMPDFDFDVKFSTVSFTLTRIGKDGTRQSVQNSGARYEEPAAALVKMAQKDDVFVYSNILAIGPGDKMPRVLLNLGYVIE